jgi:hypothetical protein
MHRTGNVDSHRRRARTSVRARVLLPSRLDDEVAVPAARPAHRSAAHLPGTDEPASERPTRPIRQTRAFVFRVSYSDCEMAPASSMALA